MAKLETKNVIDGHEVESIGSMGKLHVYAKSRTENDKERLYLVDNQSKKVLGVIDLEADCEQNMGYISSMTAGLLTNGK